jgi:acyl-CoA hydrolase
VYAQHQVGVRVEAEDMRSGQRWHCCSAYLTFVALNSKSKVGSNAWHLCAAVFGCPNSPVQSTAA